MKFIGQHIWDFISRFRNDVYLEDVDTGTIVSGGNLGLDSNNKLVKNTAGGSSLTQEEVEDFVGDLIESGNKTGITVTYDDDNDAIDMVVDHDAATNFVAEEHYRWDNDIQSTATINHVNLSSDTGEDGEVLVIDENGDAVWGAGERIVFQVRNDEGVTIAAGAPLYSRGEIGGSNRIRVGVCNANDSAKMPCIGIAMEEMNTSSTKDNLAIIAGVYNTNISGFTGLAENDILYVQNDGSLSQTKPTGESSQIQNVGVVIKTNGTILQGLKVSAIGRSNDVPNLDQNALFIGNASNQAVATDAPMVGLITAADAAAAKVILSLENVTNESKATMFSNPTFTGDVTVNSKITNTTTGNDLILESDGNVTFTIDRDNNETSQSFSFKNYNVEVANLDESGNLTLDGTVDGRDVAADGTKLDGIEDNATADQTKADIDALGIAATTAVSLTAGNKTIDGSLDIGSNTAGHDFTVYGATTSFSKMQWDASQDFLKFSDQAKIVFGTGVAAADFDSSIQANGSNLVIYNDTGNIQIGDTVEITGDLTTTGNIELGNASDTTLARSAAGTVTIEGNTIATTNKLVDTKVAAYWSSSIAGFYVPLSGATFSENTSLSTASYALMYVVPYDGKILRISSFHQNAASGTSTFEVYIDGDDSDLVNDQRGSDMTTSSFTRKFTEDCPSDWTFSKGEAIAIKRTDSVARYGVTMTVVFEFDTTT